MPRFEAELPIPIDHPAYQGHFPGRPILPGVVLLAEALAVVAATTARPVQQWTVSNVKFLHPVAPGTPLRLTCETLPADGIRFEIHSPHESVASGTLKLTARDEAH